MPRKPVKSRKSASSPASSCSPSTASLPTMFRVRKPSVARARPGKAGLGTLPPPPSVVSPAATPTKPNVPNTPTKPKLSTTPIKSKLPATPTKSKSSPTRAVRKSPRLARRPPLLTPPAVPATLSSTSRSARDSVPSPRVHTPTSPAVRPLRRLTRLSRALPSSRSSAVNPMPTLRSQRLIPSISDPSPLTIFTPRTPVTSRTRTSDPPGTPLTPGAANDTPDWAITLSPERCDDDDDGDEDDDFVCDVRSDRKVQPANDPLLAHVLDLFAPTASPSATAATGF